MRALSPAMKAELSAPKRKTWTSTPPDFGDYDKKYGLMRVKDANGKTIRVPRPNAARQDRDGIHVPPTKFHRYESRVAV